MRWIFGFQRRRVRRFECDTLLPKLGPLPQISHTDATFVLLEDITENFPAPGGDAAEGRKTSRKTARSANSSIELAGNSTEYPPLPVVIWRE
jgi:hypothetical protein